MGHPDRLLPGENPESEYLEDAELWIEIYTELIDVTEGLLARLNEPSLARAGVREEAAPISDQLQRFRRRLDFWKSRRRQLNVPEARIYRL
jgi:hypothetical protein